MGWCCVLVCSNGGSCNGSVTYYEPYENYTEAVKACDKCFQEEEEYCQEHDGSWHHEAVYCDFSYNEEEDEFFLGEEASYTPCSATL